jgi:hypothetical protein
VTAAALNAGAPAAAGLHFSYVLSAAAKVEYTVSRHVGSPAWASCPAARGHKPGTYETIYTGSGSGAAGPNSAAVSAGAHATPSGRAAREHSLTLAAVIAHAHVSAHSLRPGTYVISMIAVNAHGARSIPVTVKFWVVKRAGRRHPHSRARAR